MDVPAPARCAQHLRRAARPHRGKLPTRAIEHARAPPAKVPPGDDGHGDHVAHPQRMAPGPGLPFDPTGVPGGAAGTYRRAPSDSAAIGNLVRLATCIGGRVEVVTNCIPLLDYGTTMVTWEYDEAEYQSMSSRSHRRGPIADPDEFHHARHGGRTELRADHLGGGGVRSWRSRGRDPARPPRTKPSASWHPPSPSGGIGLVPASSRTTHGGPTSNAVP